MANAVPSVSFFILCRHESPLKSHLSGSRQFHPVDPTLAVKSSLRFDVDGT